jgi:hypothetical protein
MQLSWLVVLPLSMLWIDGICAETVTPADVLRHENGLWSLDPVKSNRRWIVIHNLRGADEAAVLHIEVLTRKSDAPVWQFDRLAAHIAITMSALCQSVRRPLTRGAVYPETFEYAFRTWTEQRSRGRAPLCTTTIDRCLKGDW